MTSRGVMTRGSSGDCWCDRKFVSTDGHRGGAGAIATSGHREPGPGLIMERASQWSLDITDATFVNASNQTTPRRIYELLFFS